jgi:hypothetical protein
MGAPTRWENRLKTQEEKKALAQRLLRIGQKPAPQEVAADETQVESESSSAVAAPAEAVPFADARCGAAEIDLRDRALVDVALKPQPWLARLVNAALTAAARKEIHLCLVWPGHINSVALAHALATFERYAIGDKRGIRALLFPSKRSSFEALHRFLADRDAVLKLTRRYLTITQSAGAQAPLAGRDNSSKDAMLLSLESIRKAEPTSPPPALAELLPHFEWDADAKSWGSYAARFLKRSRSALQLGVRKHLWKEGEGHMARLGNPLLASDALFALPHQSSTKDWKAAFKSPAFQGPGQPELLLCDLTRAMSSLGRNLQRRVVDMLATAEETWPNSFGALLITDDPRTYFAVRKQLQDKLPRKTGLVYEPLACLADDYGIASAPYAPDWVPTQVPLKHYPVVVLDQEAALEATRLWTLASDLPPESEAQQAARTAGAYVLRLAGLPGGYRDYIRWMELSGFTDSARLGGSWTEQEARLQFLLDQGEFGDKAEAVRRVMGRVVKLLTAYAEATPLALRLAKEVGVYAEKRKTVITVAFRFNADIAIAQAFFERYADFPGGQSFAAFRDRVRFINHRELADKLAEADASARFVLAGLPDSSLRLLLSTSQLHADCTLFLDYRRAQDLATSLRALQSIDEYKPFRGRIAGLALEIERQLKGAGSAIDVERLLALRPPRLSLAAEASERSRQQNGLPDSWRLVLDGDRSIQVGQRVYVYEPDDIRTFKQRATKDVKAGDRVFVMSEELKDHFEACLIAAGHGVVRGATYGQMLRNCHRDIDANSKRFFGDTRLSERARRVHARMIELDREAEKCGTYRLRYWLDVADSAEVPPDELKPHSTWSRRYFELFARALEIPEALISTYWLVVTGQRRALQEAGRELTERYAQVLFNEESAQLHYRLSRATISELQAEAARNTHRVVDVVTPEETVHA